ncbi:hypothetical protein [Janibacter massiliensis]|uniref:hypothetical protein n=1 Tax=Janibacter massiliensis TaxID=2058291 RepID=UPI001F2C0A44|nr:hypothetical protein [Janibacter massiliensis]
MSDEGTPRRPRRPLHFGPDAMEAHGGSIAGPAEAAEAAHAAAATLVGAGREGDDPQRAACLVRLVEDVGLDTLADLWAQRPARSLPGVLWRLYVLRAWVWRAPSVAAREYAEGMRTAEVQHVVAGMAEPPGPDEVRDLADQILSGLFTGDLAVALERAAAFCRVVAIGRTAGAVELGTADENADEAHALTRSAASMMTMADDLTASAGLHRSGALH